MFDIVFRGDIAPGHQLPQVKQRMAALFKRTPEQIEPLFAGTPVALKKNVEAEAAEKYKKVLLQAGALVEVRPAGTLNTPVSRPKPVARARPAPAPAPAEPKPQAVPAQAGLSLAPMEGNLLSDAERASGRPEAVPVAALNAELRPVGEPLLDDEEVERSTPLVVPEVEFDLADVGADIIDAEYRAQPTPPPVADLDADLAPAGSDLGEIKRPPAPPAPDTSGISLAD